VLNVYGPDWRERSALGLPVPAEALARRVRRATRALSMERPVVLVGDPSHGRLLGRCGESAGVYHCTDDFAAGDPAHADSIRRDEDATVAAADVVLCVSEPLKDRLAPRTRRTLVLPNAVDVEAMRRFAAEPAPPRGWVSPPGPRVVYAGYLNRRVDVEALAHAVAANPSLSFVFVGAGRPPGGTGDALGALAAAPNAYWLGWRDRRDLAWIVSRCDLGLVPYRLDEFNRSCSPLKVHEYAALGVPVLATPIPATAGLGDAIRVADAGSFAAAIPEELAAAPARRVLLDALVMPHSWDLRAETVAAALGVLPRPVADR
jgi:glycosyltransferase involved in cell wall biosynthesis